MKNPDKGKEHLKKAIELQPDIGDSNYLMGQVLAEEGRYRESTDYFRKAFIVSPGTANATMLHRKAVKLMPDNWKLKALPQEDPELAPK